MAQQKPKKDLSFCGWKYKDSSHIRIAVGKKLDFIQIKDGDTVVDIGAQSGTFLGCISVIVDFKQLNFILVDIDSNCLNKQKVDNMIAHYSKVKGEALKTNFTIVQNTTDSLYLPENSYTKILLMNTLHEIPDKVKMIRDICAVMKKGGELILDELMARPKHLIHGGCNQALMDEAEVKKLFEENGFRQADIIMNISNPKKIVNPEYLGRFIKN